MMIQMADEDVKQDSINEIKKLIKTDRLVIGTENVVKAINENKIEAVYLSSNCPADTIESIEHYAGMVKTAVIRLDVPNDELGIICKKMFSISVLGIIK